MSSPWRRPCRAFSPRTWPCISDGGCGAFPTFYAVDDFLERFVGVRFYFPGDAGTVIPSLKKWAVPAIDLADRPDMQTRTMYTYDPFPSNFLGGGSVRWYEGAPRKEAYQLSQRARSW